MSTPTSGDPRRPLYLAIRSLRTLGLVSMLFGVLFTLPLLVGQLHRPSTIVTIAGGVFFMFGAAFIVCAIFLRRRSAWAITLGICLTSLLLLFPLCGLIVAATRQWTGGIVGCLIYAAALGQLLYHLSMSYAAMRFALESESRGFEVEVRPTGTPVPLPPIGTNFPEPTERGM